MEFVIDTIGQADLSTKEKLVQSDDDDPDITVHNSSSLFDFDVSLNEKKQSQIKSKLNPQKDIDLEEFEKDMGWRGRRKPKKLPDVTLLTQQIIPIDKVLEKSVIKPGFEKLHTVPPYDPTEKELKKARRALRKQTKGSEWFNLPAPEITEEMKHDLEIIKMRSALDPKHFYKKNDMKTLPKYFQIGKIMDSPLDYYSDRLTKKERKRTLVDELMADAEFSKYNKRKYKEIIEEKKKTNYKAYMHAKKLKRKRK